jgi:uncharacterized protein (DUF58 family)
MPIPTKRLAAVAAVLALVAFGLPAKSWTLFWGIVGLTVALLVVDALLGASPKSIEVERILPGGVTIGDTATVTWMVRNRTARPLRVTIADQLWPSFNPTRRRVSLRLKGHARSTVTARVSPTRRGRFPVEELAVRVESPLGFAARQSTRMIPDVLRVFPPFRSKDEAELRIRRAQLISVGLRSARGRGGGTEFEQLRDYTPDDNFRRVDWAATARTGKPIVRTYRAERNQTIVILLDNGRLMAGTVGGVPRVEYAMDAAMALTAVATQAGDRVGLIAFDRQVRATVPPGVGSSQLSRITEAMYRLEPVFDESDYAGVFAHAAARFRRRVMFVLLTDLVEATIAESVAPALPVLGRQHLIVVASISDPEVRAWAAGDLAATGPELVSAPVGEALDAAAVFRQAAAIGSLEQRRRTVAKLSSTAAVVIDSDPARLAPELVDTYLRFKATGRL